MKHSQRDFQNDLLSELRGQLVQGEHSFPDILDQLLAEHQNGVNDMRNMVQHGSGAEARVEQGPPVLPFIPVHGDDIRATGHRPHRCGGNQRLRQVVLVANLVGGFRAEQCEQSGIHWPEVNEEELGVCKLLAEVPHCERDGCIWRDSIQIFREHEQVTCNPVPSFRHGLQVVSV